MSPLRKITGIVCIVLGVIAMITPFTPGAWLIIIGLSILGVELAIDENTFLGRTAKKLGLKLKKKQGTQEIKKETLAP